MGPATSERKAPKRETVDFSELDRTIKEVANMANSVAEEAAKNYVETEKRIEILEQDLEMTSNEACEFAADITEEINKCKKLGTIGVVLSTALAVIAFVKFVRKF